MYKLHFNADKTVNSVIKNNAKKWRNKTKICLETVVNVHKIDTIEQFVVRIQFIHIVHTENKYLFKPNMYTKQPMAKFVGCPMI